MPNTNSTADQSFEAMQLARTEARLRYVAGDLAAMVDRGEIAADEANATYERTASRWMAE